MGELLLVNSNCEFIKLVDQSLVNKCNIECIIPYSKGFVVAGENLNLYFYEATFDEKTHYVKTKTVIVIICFSIGLIYTHKGEKYEL